ncbi:MAG: colanic acid exporter [Deltaproteobacteria bacterium HGW-Deltaproteobacteria-4]|nr:MAG: colanic acid exporter [Deltaproteobacteria bacterium HGW-Deltaproteobacteria-4]
MSQGVTQVVSLLIMILLTRLLSPREFGLVAMVTAISGFVGIFAEMGLGAALIHQQKIDDEQLSSVFWLNLFLGVVLTAVFVLAAPLVADFYNEPLLLGITIVVALNFIINALTIVQRILATKALDFQTLAISEVASTLISGGIVLFLAYQGYSYWSIVWQTLIISVVSNIILWQRSTWRPRFCFSFASIRGLMRFGGYVIGTHTLDYWTRNIDNLLIGKFFGSEVLGLYSRAYSFLVFRINSVSRIVSRVFFPAIAGIQHDKERVKKIFLKTIGAIALVTFPLTVGLFATADNFVLTLLGARWMEMVPIVRALCLLGLTTAAGSLTANIFLSQGESGLHFRLGLILKMTVVAGIVLGLRWGAFGVALCYGLVTLVNVYPTIRIAGRLIGMGFNEYLKTLAPAFTCSLIMAGPVWILPKLIFTDNAVWLILITQILLGGVLYVGTLHLFRIKIYLEILELMQVKLYGKSTHIKC